MPMGTELNTKCILITGGAGFIGSNFARHCQRRFSHLDVLAVVDALTYAGNRATLADLENSDGFFFEEGSICNKSFIAQLLTQYNIECRII